MKKLFLAILLITLAATVGAAQVKITPHKVVYKRVNPQSEYKATFEITYPVIRASTPALSRKIEKALSYEKHLGINIKEEINEIQWLMGAEYEVDHNKGNVLSMRLFMEGAGAYPSGSTDHVVVDTSTGIEQTPAMVFANMPGLLKLVRAARDKEVREAKIELKKEADNEGYEEAFRDSAKYHPVTLKHFSVSDKGLTFHHDYDFAHVIKAMEPSGEFFFSWARLRPFLKRGGLFANMGR